VPSVIEQILLAREWAPVLRLLSAISTASESAAKAAAALELLKFLAHKTNTRMDDDLLAWLEVALKVPEAKLIFDWLAHLQNVIAVSPPPTDGGEQ